MSLSSQGAVRTLGESRSQLYELRDGHPLESALKFLFEAEQEHWRGLRNQLAHLLGSQPGLRGAWLYGSVARGDDTPLSDVDLAVVFDSNAEAPIDTLRNELASFERAHNVHVSLVALSPVLTPPRTAPPPPFPPRTP